MDFLVVLVLPLIQLLHEVVCPQFVSHQKSYLVSGQSLEQGLLFVLFSDSEKSPKHKMSKIDNKIVF